MNQSYSLTIFFFFFFIFVLACADEDQDFLDCNVPFNCGKLVNISYPFWGNDRPKMCGHHLFGLECSENTTTTMFINQHEYQVEDINSSSHTIKISRPREGCPPTIGSETLGYSLNLSSTVKYLILFYNCTTNPFLFPESSYNFSCPVDGTEKDVFYAGRYGEAELKDTACNGEVEVPVEDEVLGELYDNGDGNLSVALKKPFGLNYFTYRVCDPCVASGGNCGTNLSSPTPGTQFICYCHDGHHQPFKCADDKDQWKLKLKIGIVIMCIIFYFYLRYLRKKNSPSLYSRNISSYPSSVRDHGNEDKFIGVHTFGYSELEKATNNFDEAEELGDGGFGTVYKGKLRDGRIVAVKRLYENNYKRVEQFLNEVEILARLRHPHLVALYGCTSRHCRELLLVYEYVPNGTVADHLHGEGTKPGELTWPIRLKIAVETATALAFLHVNDVIHRDVKTNNILLGNNFDVKVADFGLSRLFPTDVTHVSTAPQGTPGYVDPEYHQCYQLTSKSDVYSFGVVLIELISSMPAVDITRHRHEINLSNMAINKIQSRALHELVDPSLGFETEPLVRQMITGVAELAFQCLQSSKEMRPSMVEVLENLKGIQSDVYGAKEAEETDIRADDVVLLKTSDLQLTTSPVSVSMSWASESTTPTTSA
ncbi:LEAF RUST 10 DISEASE-RESISTANCE LOCUS RECEPTOR-LIKE PROTEIN KINASE-like 1.2 isoform X2 [Tripterygium wilfordii]|uniref:LEAF RUST 10 DISEASE-RESISTANCE LOCUS RECEPTOR-LIKE PROTEIN KINASE-like 1.2 isoform X2 n=1 Tax=Tripterygium wilfordii TaxID=458696 RepID=UPI0018F803CA|nr:LEAF RUST 10 DISEASE-RESISTANCE LOCUS RECEPTOR-LIKE PROTEIN KINASE-like 1.2 isoform X2 [Tripterygium wilfordii]